LLSSDQAYRTVVTRETDRTRETVLQERPYPYKEIVTQFIKISFYTFYNSFSMAYAAQPHNKRANIS